MPEFTLGRNRLYAIAVVVLVLLIWLFRIPILRATGDALVKEDRNAKGDALYVLGGAVVERALAAKRFMDEGVAPVLVCTGSNSPDVLRLYGLQRSEAEISRRVAVLAGVPEVLTSVLEEGTSTWEEALAVRDHALINGYDTVVVVTTEFHTRRVSRVFNKVLSPAGLTVMVRAAPSARYNPACWWTSEEGLLMVNNEYVKLLYYWLTY